MNLHIPSSYHPPEQPTVAPGHFWRTDKLGRLPLVWHCWCGDSLTLNYDVRGMARRMYDFFDAHVDCVPAFCKNT